MADDQVRTGWLIALLVSAQFVVAILMPLWSFYLVKVYAWRTMLSADGVINWALGPLHIHR